MLLIIYLSAEAYVYCNLIRITHQPSSAIQPQTTFLSFFYEVFDQRSLASPADERRGTSDLAC